MVKNSDMNRFETAEITAYPACFAVVDGMGGRPGGAEAARLLTETCAEACAGGKFGQKFDPAEDRKVIAEILKEASERMYAESRKNPELSEMGATIAGLLIRENGAMAFNCGDCRVYRFQCGNDIEKLTKDHSVVQALLDMGHISEDEMRTHSRKNIVTSAVVALEAHEPEFYAREISRIDDDEYFLCSDGVWETIPADELRGFLSGPFPESADELLNALLSSGCRDNISFVWLANADAKSPSRNGRGDLAGASPQISASKALPSNPTSAKIPQAQRKSGD
jgi:protein phosphatase